MTVCVVEVDCCWRSPFGDAAEGEVYSAGLLLIGCVKEVADDLAVDYVYTADDHYVSRIFI